VVSVAGLQGNRTHGDHVTAVGALGDVALINVAATSDCGKPMHPLGGGGPPAHALGHASKGLEKAETAKEAAQKADEA
jgi:hypothetical protein